MNKMKFEYIYIASFLQLC